MSIGKFAKNLILTTNLSNTEILERVLEAFPTAKTSMACIAWYKSDLRKKGQLAKPGAAPILTPEQRVEAMSKKVDELRAALEAAELELELLVQSMEQPEDSVGEEQPEEGAEPSEEEQSVEAVEDEAEVA